MKTAGLIAALLAAAACSGDDGRAARTAARDSTVGAAGTVADAATFNAATTYVGIRYDSLPSPFALESGALLPRGPGSSEAGYDFDLVRTPHGEMVWLDSIVRVAGRAKPGRVVRAELRVPPLAKDERLVMASCDVSGRLDPHVVAIVVVQNDSTTYRSIRQAWRADAGSGQFDVIPVTGITCAEPGT